MYTVHGEIVEADSWYVSVQPCGNAKGVRVDLRINDFGESTGEKSRCSHGYSRPYRKPTQVLESSRLRLTREPSLRNSAIQRPELRDKVCPLFIEEEIVAYTQQGG